MRSTFIDTLTEMARNDERIMCVIGDTGFSVFEEFEKEFGSRFVNVGIAEQNFVSFGAGLSAMGMKPYIYNVASFMTLRAMEQIVLDVCYQENPVVMIGVGGGFAYATAGPTHHALQDIAMLSAIPNLTIVCPGDPMEMKAVMFASLEYEKPLYIRIGRSVNPLIHSAPIDFEFGKAIKMTDGADAVLISTGVMLKDAMEIYDLCNKDGISVAVYSMPTIKPIDAKVVQEAMSLGVPIYTLEEHSIIGGLGDAVGRIMLEKRSVSTLHKFGVPDMFAPVTGTREYLNDLFGISPLKVVEYIKNDLKRQIVL